MQVQSILFHRQELSPIVYLLCMLCSGEPVVTMQAVTLANISEPLKLSCVVTGVPLPQVKFISTATGVAPTNQSEMVRQGPGHQKYVELAWQRPSASLLDDGEYQCVAMNVLGRQHQSGNLSVQCKSQTRMHALLCHCGTCSCIAQFVSCFLATCVCIPLVNKTMQTRCIHLRTSIIHVFATVPFTVINSTYAVDILWIPMAGVECVRIDVRH